MSLPRERFSALVIFFAAMAVLFPVQNAIDVRRNTFKVWLYPDANDDDKQAVVDALKKAGLEPRLGVATRVDNSYQRLQEMEGAKRRLVYRNSPYVAAVVPRQEWGRDLYKYVTATQRLEMVSGVVPGLNEQGLPLDRLQELNVQDVGIVVMAALIGGFRKSAANVLWLQSDANWYGGRAYRTVPLARAVVTLDPHFVDAWTVTCWHLAYNMSVEAKDPNEAADLIRQGIEFAEQGLSWNSTRYELFLEIGWTYYDKLQNYARAAEYFKLALNHPHPTFVERHIAHAYERIPDIDSALFWYNVSLKKYQQDPVATGATITINERYVRAWNEYKQGNLDKALRYLQEDWQKDDPFDTIAMHFKARIFETKAEQARKRGDTEEAETHYRVAFETWRAAGEHSAVDRLARRRVLTLASNFGWGEEVPLGWNDVGLPDRWAAADEMAPEAKRTGPMPGAQTPDSAPGAAPPGAAPPATAPVTP